MTSTRMKVVHYINQFFAGVGGEESADVGPSLVEGPLGPGKLLDRTLGSGGEVVATIVCGDTYFAEHQRDATSEVMDMILAGQYDLAVVGPAFNSGRYGLACVTVATECGHRAIPAVTGMYSENPGLPPESEATGVLIVRTGATAAGMRSAIESMVRIGKKILAGRELSTPETDGYMPRGIRKNVADRATTAERAVDQLLLKLRGGNWRTEIHPPTYDTIEAPQLTVALNEARVALVTEGSIVPRGNPDRLESARATQWLKYPLDGCAGLSSDSHMTVHGGFDNGPVNDDPNRVLPADALVELAKNDVIGAVHSDYYVTTGMATAIREAERIGREIVADLLRERVHAVLVTST